MKFTIRMQDTVYYDVDVEAETEAEARAKIRRDIDDGEDLDMVEVDNTGVDFAEPDVLVDWNSAPDGDADPDPVAYGVERTPVSVTATFATGEKIWIEREDGRIRVHCYDGETDAPVNVEIEGGAIRVDDFDYRTEA